MAFPGHAGRRWPLACCRSLTRIRGASPSDRSWRFPAPQAVAGRSLAIARSLAFAECLPVTTDEMIRRAPKVLLHDHLDGGVRPSTVVDLAEEYGYDKLPTTDVEELSAWFNRGAKRNDLVMYLETFA